MPLPAEKHDLLVERSLTIHPVNVAPSTTLAIDERRRDARMANGVADRQDVRMLQWGGLALEPFAHAFERQRRGMRQLAHYLKFENGIELTIDRAESSLTEFAATFKPA